MALSGTREFNPNLGEVVIAAFARIGVRRPEITQQHLSDAQMEVNLLQTDFQGDGICLWENILQTYDLEPGKSTYDINPNTVFVLDLYIRQNPTPLYVRWLNDRLEREIWQDNIGSPLPWAPSPGYDPESTFIPQIVFWVNNNGVLSGWSNNNGVVSNWTGVTVPQVIAPVPPYAPPNNFNVMATDRLLIPFSRSDYAATATKQMPGFPTSYYVNYLLQPTITLWPVPTQFVPDGLQFYSQLRMQTADLADGTQIMIPYQVFDYFVWALAERLGTIYAPERLAAITPRKQESYMKYMQSTTENIPLNIDTQLGSYFRVG
jgi:hypothetical protein